MRLIQLQKETQLWVCSTCMWNRQKIALAATHSKHRSPPPTAHRQHACTKSVIPVSPASEQKTFLARTQICSWARRGTSWCLLSCQGAPTRSCRDAWKRSDTGREVESCHSNPQGQGLDEWYHTCSLRFKSTDFNKIVYPVLNIKLLYQHYLYH